MHFLNPWLLIGLVAVGIPIAVHLFNFRRYRKIYFSNVRFLKEIKQQTRKQSNLLHRLVLLFRILAFVFLALAFAQPFFPAKNKTVAKDANIVSVFVDNSFSMEAEGTRGTLLDEAKDKAAEVANAYARDDQFQLLTNDFEGKHQRLVSRDEFITMLNEVTVSPAVRSLKEISARQHDVISSNIRGNKVVHYISDFQKSTIYKTLPDSGFQTGYIIPLQAASVNNLFIDTCWFSNPVLQMNEQVTLNVRITNVSEIRLEKIPLRLMIDDVQRSAASIDIDAGSSQEIGFTFSNQKAGTHKGLLEINDYPVTYDDIYYFTFRISPEIPVLSINENTPNSYVNSVFTVDSILKLTNTPVRQIDISALSSYRLIILNGLTSYSSGLQQELLKFAENGGSILIIPSLETPLDAHNQLHARLGTDLFNGINTSPVKLSKVNTNHPIYREVFEQGSLKEENLDMPIINSFFTVPPASTGRSETLLELANGQPLLTISNSGKGKIYLFTAPLDDKSGNFIRHAIFVPTMLNIAFNSETINPLMYYTDRQDPIAISGTFTKSDNVIKLAEIEGKYEFIPEFRQINGQNNIFINGQIQQAGFYKVISDNKQIDLLAFNYNRTESDLISATNEDLELLNDKTGYSIITNSEKPLNTLLNEHNGENKLWKWFIFAALLSLIIETILLAFFKRKSAAV